MSHAVTYMVMPERDYQQLRDALDRPEMVGVETACKMFDISVSLIETLVNEKKLTRYRIPGHPRSTRFKLNELQNLFNPE